MEVSAKITLRHDTTVNDLLDVLTAIPKDAKISVRSYTADRPGESSYSTMEFRWKLPVGQ